MKLFLPFTKVVTALVILVLVFTTRSSAQIVITPTATDATCVGSCDGAIDLVITGTGVAPYTYTWSNGGTSIGSGWKDQNNAAVPNPTEIDFQVKLCPGAYTVTVTDKNGLTKTSSSTIGIAPPNKLAVVSDPSNVLCVSACTGSIKVNVSGGNTPYTYAWNGSAVTGNVRNGLCAGTYSVTVSDAGGCDSILTYVVGPNPAVTATGGSACAGGTVVLTASGASSYSWTSGPTSATYSVTPGVGTTTYTVTGTNSGCPNSTSTAIVTINPAASVSATGTNVACNGKSTGSAIATPGTGTAPYAYNWLPSGGAAQTATGLPSGTYTVTITDSKGCTSTSTTTLAQPPVITTAASQVKPACGAVTGSATVTVGGGTPGYSYLWSGGPTTATGATGQTYSGLPAGGYNVTITDANGCTKTDVVTVSNTPSPTATLTGNPPLCKGGSTGTASVSAVGGTPGYTYSWSTTATGVTGITGLTAAIYVVSVTDANGCIDVKTVTITDPSAVTGTTSFANATCGASNGTASVIPAGGTGSSYSYSWSPAGGTGQTTTGVPSALYTVTIKDGNGCTGTATANVGTVNGGVASATIVTPIKCAGDKGSVTVTISGGVATSYTYAWAPTGGTSPTASNLSGAIYTVNITDNNGCTTSSTVTLASPTAITATPASTNAICTAANGSVSVSTSGGTGAFVYLWNSVPAATGQTVSGLVSGPYIVTVTDANGCTQSTTATVGNTNGSGTATTSIVTNIKCAGNTTGVVSVAMAGGTAGFTYSWSPTGGTASSASNLGFGTYTVDITDANGCTASSTVSLTEPAALTALSSKNDAICGTPNGSVSVTPGGGSPAYTYAWSGGAGSASAATGLNAGSYVVTVTDNNGCTISTTAIVSNIGGPSASATTVTNVTCNGGKDGSATASISGGGTPPYTGLWSTQGFTGQTITGLSQGTYSVTITDANGCSSISTVAITEPPVINVSSAPATAACGQSNGSAVAAISGGTGTLTAVWTPGGATGLTITGKAAGSYTVTVTDGSGCTKTDIALIGNTPSPTISSITGPPLTCNGNSNGTATVVASGGSGTLTYNWSNGNSGTGVTGITGLTSGTYIVSVTDASGCTALSQVTITEPTVVTALTSSTAATCGSSNGTASVTPGGGSGSPYTVTWNTSATSLTITGLAAKSYTVVVADANGCTTSSTATVNNTGGPVINASLVSNVKCNGGTDGSANVVVTSGGVAPYIYAWSSTAVGANATGLKAGPYDVTVTDANGCKSISTVTITEPPIIAINTVPTKSACGQSNGSAVASAAGGTGSLTYSWDNGATGPTISGVPAKGYTVTVTDGSGCTQTAIVAIGDNPAPTISSLTNTTLKCTGDNNGTATVTASGGVAPLIYSWSTGLSGSAATGATGLTAGSYVVTVTDASGCKAISTVSIADPAPVTALTSSTDATCGASNGTASVATGGGSGSPYTVIWNTSATSLTITGLVAQTYTAVVTDANGCTTSSTATVNNTGGPVITASLVSNVNCNGGSDGSANVAVTSGGTTPYTYSWNSAASGQTVQTAVGLKAGTYDVTVTDAIGCKSISTVTITEPTSILTSVSSTKSSCGKSNGSVSVTSSGGTGFLSAVWTPGGAGQTISALPAGSYNVTITDQNGCTKTDVVAVTDVPGPTVSTSISSLNCNGDTNGSATVNATGAVPLTYLWNDPAGSTGTTATGLSAGTYVVTVTDVNNCTGVKTVSITEPTAVVATTQAFNASCGTANGSATVSAAGGTGAFTYLWSNVPASTTTTASNLAVGQYTVTVTDFNGCKGTSTANIINNGGPQLTAANVVNVACNGGNNGSATVTISGGTAPLTYAWSTGATVTTSSLSSTVSALVADTFMVTVTDANSCKLITSVTVTEPSAITAPTTSSNAACGLNNGSASVAPTGGTGTYTYLWSSPANSATSSASNLGVGTYVVTVKDANGCIKTASVTIGNSNGPTSATSVASAVTCSGTNTGSATVTVTSGISTPYTYSWSNGPSTITSLTTNTITSVGAGTYKVTITDAKGCSKVDSVKLVDAVALAIIKASTAAKCGSTDGTASATASGGTSAYTYSWSSGATTQTATNLGAGIYTVTATDNKGCTITVTDTVKSISAAVLNVIPAKETIQEGGSVSITVTGAVTYSWSPGAGLTCTDCPNPIATPSVSTVYTVTATDRNGCTVTAQLSITVKQACADEADVFIANIFSPNGDGKNDILMIQGTGLSNIYWAIYDRWGNLLFESFKQSDGWDGTKRGNPMEQGTYVWYLKATCIKTNSEVKLKGNTTIVK
jgi:gliding motility-associated-like protein